MNKKTKKYAKSSFFKRKGGIISTQELKAQGFSYYSIQKMLKNKDLTRIKRGMYKYSGARVSEWTEIQKLVPKGYLCLYSAALIHELSTFIPMTYHIAVTKNRKVKLPSYPPIQLYNWNEKNYKLGQNKKRKDGQMVYIYDEEKTVCDFFRLRHKTGLAIPKEVLKNYLKKRGRNINKLTRYAKQLRVRTILNQYLEVLL